MRRDIFPAAASRWGVPDAAAGFLVALVLSAVAGVVLAGAQGWHSTDDIPIWGIAVLEIPLWVGLLGSVGLATFARGARSLRGDFGFTMRRRDVPFGLALGTASQYFVSYVVSWPIITLSGASSDDFEKPARQLADKAKASSWWGMVLLVLVVVVGAPLVEELFYRGLLQRSMLRLARAPVAVGVTAVVFGLSHFELLQLPALVVFGLILGTVAYRSGRLGPSLWTHIGFNATTVVTLLWDRVF